MLPSCSFHWGATTVVCLHDASVARCSRLKCTVAYNETLWSLYLCYFFIFLATSKDLDEHRKFDVRLLGYGAVQAALFLIHLHTRHEEKPLLHFP